MADRRPGNQSMFFGTHPTERKELRESDEPKKIKLSDLDMNAAIDREKLGAPEQVGETFKLIDVAMGTAPGKRPPPQARRPGPPQARPNQRPGPARPAPQGQRPAPPSARRPAPGPARPAPARPAPARPAQGQRPGPARPAPKGPPPGPPRRPPPR